MLLKAATPTNSKDNVEVCLEEFVAVMNAVITHPTIALHWQPSRLPEYNMALSVQAGLNQWISMVKPLMKGTPSNEAAAAYAGAAACVALAVKDTGLILFARR